MRTVWSGLRHALLVLKWPGMPPGRRVTALGALATLLLVLVAVGACSKRSYDYESAPASQMAYEESAGGAAPEAPPAAAAPSSGDVLSSRGSYSGLVSKRGDKVGESRDRDYGEKGKGEDTRQETPQKKLVHYNGYAQLRVTRPTEALDSVAQLASGMGGYVERLGSTSVTVRVPVARFEQAFQQVLLLGDVLQKSVSAQDVSDSMLEVGLRLDTARATRDRLMALLARARTEQEKISLLREIQRVTEEIDRLEAQVRTLESLAAFSRITVEVVQRQALSARSTDEEVAEFRWIQHLSPFNQDVAHSGKPLKLDTPEGMVELDIKRRFIAESADGAKVWTSILKNNPKGTSAFWLEAVEGRLASEFGEVQHRTLGGFEVLRLVDRSETPYVYLIGVHAVDDDLELVEVYYPSTAQEERYEATVNASIQKGKR